MIKTLAVCALVFILAGCTTYRKTVVEWSEEDVLNRNASYTAARNLMKTWAINSGFIRGVLGASAKELPYQFLEAMNELDGLYEELKTRPMTDFEAGYSLGLRVRMAGQVVKEALTIYAPDLLVYVPYLAAF